MMKVRAKAQSPSTSSGQSTVEYILLVTAVIAVVLIVTNGQNSIFQSRLTNVVDITSNRMINMANRLTSISP